jgi:hypothetical protein
MYHTATHTTKTTETAINSALTAEKAADAAEAVAAALAAMGDQRSFQGSDPSSCSDNDGCNNDLTGNNTSSSSQSDLYSTTLNLRGDPSCEPSADHENNDELSRENQVNRELGEIGVDWCCDVCKICYDLQSSGSSNSPYKYEAHNDDDEGDGRRHLSLSLAMHYLKQARINLNSRRVTHTSGVWIDKCGTGAVSKCADTVIEKIQN